MKTKRIWSFFLTVAMLLSFLPGIAVPAEAADNYNQLINGNFDQGETGWGKNQHFTAGSVTDGVLVVSSDKTSTGDAIFYQGMNLVPGTYVLTFDGKGTANQYRPIVYIGINQWSNAYGKHFLKDFGFNDEWKTATVSFTVPDSAAGANGLAPVYVALWTSNGSYAPETEMQLDNFAVRKLLNVTTELHNAALGAGITEIAQGLPYENTVTANTGYQVAQVTVTMGGVEVPNAYDPLTGKIRINAVAGDLHIQVQAAQTDLGNELVNGNFDLGAAGWANNGIAPAATVADGVLTLPAQKTASGDARTYAALQLAPGTYQLSFDVKGTPVKYRPYVGVSKNYWTNDYGQYFMYDYSLSDTDWTTVTETFTIPESAAGADGLAPVYVTIWNSNQAYAPATEMQFDNFAVRKLLKITTELSNVTLSQTITEVAQGLSYENTVAADDGCAVSKVTVKMGGVVVPNAYDPQTGKLRIAAVTGDLLIQIEAAATDPSNLLTNGNFDQGNTGWANNGIAPTASISDGVLTLPAEKTASGDARTYAALQLAPGAYQLSFDVKGTPMKYRPYVGVSKNYWTNDYGQYFMYDYNLSETEWTTVTETFTVPESAAGTDGLAPVYVTIWNSNQAYGPETPMQFDNFAVSAAFQFPGPQRQFRL